MTLPTDQRTQRPIKLRWWDPYFKEWADVDSCKCENGYLVPQWWDIESQMPSDYGHELTPSMFTGLHDKNGKEIWEGDVVRCYKDSESWLDYEVKWETNGLTFGAWMIDGRGFPEDQAIEVIGNIFSNPELLKP